MTLTIKCLIGLFGSVVLIGMGGCSVSGNEDEDSNSMVATTDDEPHCTTEIIRSGVDEVEEQKDKWQLAGLNDFVMILAIESNLPRQTVVKVEGGRIVSAYLFHLGPGTFEDLNEEQWTQVNSVYSILDLFNFVASSNIAEVTNLTVTYDPNWGYPATIFRSENFCRDNGDGTVTSLIDAEALMSIKLYTKQDPSQSINLSQ